MLYVIAHLLIHLLTNDIVALILHYQYIPVIFVQSHFDVNMDCNVISGPLPTIKKKGKAVSPIPSPGQEEMPSSGKPRAPSSRNPVPKLEKAGLNHLIDVLGEGMTPEIQKALDNGLIVLSTNTDYQTKRAKK